MAPTGKAHHHNHQPVRDDDEQSNVSRISPWNNKEEFVQVYDLLFGDCATPDSMRQACEFLAMWKMRRQHLTPASILSTLTILEVYLQDDPGCQDAGRRQSMQKLYSHAFTRFLNYMSSILQTRQLKSMYMTAKELGLDSFMVDLRHLCAHGHDLPDLDVFQRSATYLLDWLHKFYWKRELETIEDAQVQNVHQDRSLEYEESLKALFHVYDTATEALHNSCRQLKDIKAGHPFDEETAKSLKQYGNYHQLDRLSVIVTKVSNELVTLACQELKIRGNDEIFCHVLLQCPFFMATAATYCDLQPSSSDELKSNAADFINQHQNLFRSLAICGFIETCFHSLVQICEDEHESHVRRLGAQFWANQVAAGFLLFKDVKRAFQKRKEKNSDFVIDLAPLNTHAMNEDIRMVYKRLGVNCSGVLIFGDTIRRPWTLTFSHHFVNERMASVNVYTKDVLEKCMRMVEPALSAEQHSHLTQLMATYVASEEAGADVTSRMDETDTVYSVDKHLLSQQMEMGDADLAGGETVGEKTFGIWSEVSDEHNWKSVPIGRLPWE